MSKISLIVESSYCLVGRFGISILIYLFLVSLNSSCATQSYSDNLVYKRGPASDDRPITIPAVNRIRYNFQEADQAVASDIPVGRTLQCFFVSPEIAIEEYEVAFVMLESNQVGMSLPQKDTFQSRVLPLSMKPGQANFIDVTRTPATYFTRKSKNGNLMFERAGTDLGIRPAISSPEMNGSAYIDCAI
jgi:hypothetical protein